MAFRFTWHSNLCKWPNGLIRLFPLVENTREEWPPKQMDKATECDSGNERWKWSEWKIWIPAAKKEKKKYKRPKVGVWQRGFRPLQPTGATNETVSSCQLRLLFFFNSFKFYGKISSQKNFLNMLNHLNIISSNIN